MHAFSNRHHFLLGFALSLLSSVALFLYLELPLKKALFGYFYFLVTPFLAISAFPVSIIVLIILILLFRRVSSCMRQHLRWVAYLLLFLHWIAFGFYCSSYVVG
ncbi:hypothetical protein D3C81_1840770 [compost metagenome]